MFRPSLWAVLIFGLLNTVACTEKKTSPLGTEDQSANSAATASGDAAEDQSADSNATASAELSDAYIPGLGSIVFISSLGSRFYNPSYPLGSMKAAMETVVRDCSESLRPQGIRINGVCGGIVRTDRLPPRWTATRLRVEDAADEGQGPDADGGLHGGAG